MKQKTQQYLHFIGIGGIGLSALAKIYLKKGLTVSGSDLKQSLITDELKKSGAQIFIGTHKKRNLHQNNNLPDLVVYSEAVSINNPELREAKRLKIPCQSGAEKIADFSKDYFVIAVSGMHGKTTTASMIAQILIKAKLDPTFLIGTQPNARLGQSRYLILEADEYKAKFLHYHPDLLVLTNIEEEHLDYFKNLKNILKTFRQYLQQVKKVIITNPEDQNIKKILPFALCKIKYFYPQKIKLQVPGKHNQTNAAAALTAARFLKINALTALKALQNYQGVWRRFEYRGKLKNGAIVIDDYAHHPTEIKAVLQAAKEKYPHKIIWAVFQPHQILRTKLLFKKFLSAFQDADRVVITDIFEVAGREKKIKQVDSVSGKKLARAVKKNKKNTKYVPLKNLTRFIKKNAPLETVILLMGAGDINQATKKLTLC